MQEFVCRYQDTVSRLGTRMGENSG
jgi:hypothetical protein